MKKRRSQSAFTLLELLVSLAVVVLLALMLVQIVGWVSQSWVRGQQVKENMGKGRLALDLMARDLKLGIFRPDLGAFVDAAGTPSGVSGNGNYCFFTAVTADGKRQVSLVNFRRSAEGQLLRESLAVDWAGNPTPVISFGDRKIPAMANIGAQGSPGELVNGTLGFSMYFINAKADGSGRTITPDYQDNATLRTEAVGIGLVVMDERAQRVLERTGRLGAILSDPRWAPPADLSQGLRGYWLQQVESLRSGTDLPQDVRTGLHVFESVVPLPPTVALQ
jgi:prepilin-type N-terminal cleavage/methylation domain-containing protein